jgi:hypothetical protein
MHSIPRCFNTDYPTLAILICQITSVLENVFFFFQTLIIVPQCFFLNKGVITFQKTKGNKNLSILSLSVFKSVSLIIFGMEGALPN